MRSIFLTSAALLLALGTAAPAVADELEMPQSGPTTEAPADIEMPTRGMTMDQVEKQFGKPESIDPPVGDPPITRWDYADYAVFFEYKYVIDSVVK